jgi:hypothetical protein
MAVVKAIKTGNWNDNTVWSTGLVPSAGDTVYLNSYDVTVNQNIQIGSTNNVVVNAGSFVIGQYYEIVTIGSTNFTSIGAGSNTVGAVFLATGVGTGTGTARTVATITNLANTNAAVLATAGGGLTMNTGYTIWADFRSSTVTLLNCNHVDTGNIIGNSVSGSTSNAHCIRNISTGTLNIIGNLEAIGNNMQCNALTNESTGIVYITGTVLAGQNGNHGIRNLAAGQMFVTGAAYGRNTGSSGVFNNAGGTVTVVGIMEGGNGANGATYGVNNNGAAGIAYCTGTIRGTNLNFTGVRNIATMFITGEAYAGVTGASAIENTGTLTFNGNAYDNSDGTVAIYSPTLVTGTTPVKSVIREALSGNNTFVYFYTPDYETFSLPPVSSVRTGTVYASGGLIGTMAVPSPSAVSWGVPVDNTVGTALLNPADIWSFALSSITVPDSIGARLSAVATTTDLSATNQLINQKLSNFVTVSQVGQLLADALNN